MASKLARSYREVRELSEPVPLWECDESQLLTIAKAGDSDALALLFLRLNPTLLAHIQHKIGARLGRTTSAEDILQLTHQTAFTGFEQFRGKDVTTFQAWLRKIADNQLLVAGRAAGTQKRGGDFHQVDMAARERFRDSAVGLMAELSAGNETVSHFVSRVEASEAIHIAIAALPDDQRAVIRCRYFDQLSVEQIAEKMQRSSGSVRGLLDRARAALRTTMHNSALWLSRKE